MFLEKIFKIKKTCLHEKIPPNIESAYCPDCGKLIKNEWYITKCACCGIKLQAKLSNGIVSTQYHYCTNCGSQEFEIQKLDEINFINVNYAVLVKKEIFNTLDTNSITQCWEEKTSEQPKLLTQYL